MVKITLPMKGKQISCVSGCDAPRKKNIVCGINKPKWNICILSWRNIRQTHIEGQSLTQQASMFQMKN